jgi:hypothetical protein
MEIQTQKNVKWSNGAELEDPENVLVTWVRQVNKKTIGAV